MKQQQKDVSNIQYIMRYYCKREQGIHSGFYCHGELQTR